MSRLYYKNEYRSELTEKQATRILESLSQKPRPAHLTINGELLKTAQIEVFKDVPETASLQDNKEFKAKVDRTMKEIEAMRKWTIEQKIRLNVTRNFSVKYLLRVGYKKFLGGGWEKNGSDWWWQEFEKKYKQENESEYIKLCEGLLDYFTENPDQYWCNEKIYKQFLPERKAQKTISRAEDRQLISLCESMAVNNI